MILETNRLILRQWRESDISDLIEGLNNIEVSKWLAYIPHPYTRDHAAQWINFCVENDKAGDARTSYYFAIELKPERKVIGGTSLERINKFHGTAGGGIWLNASYHGNGYATEAFGKRIQFAFADLGLRRLENGYFAGNESSLKMQQRFGYKIEGMRRKALKCTADGEYKDEYITALLIDEWIPHTL